MSKVNDVTPPRTGELEEWLRENLAEQERRHAQIAERMQAISAQRDAWVEEFFRRLQTTGYHVAGDQKRRLDVSELPSRPRRAFKVTY